MQAQTEARVDFLTNLESQEQKEVGIEHYISEGGPIPAVTKYLLTDFIVNELTPQEKLVVLSQKPNPGGYKPPVVEKPSYICTPQLHKEIAQIFGEEAANEISVLYEKLEAGQKITQWQYTAQNMNGSKEERLKIHNFVRERLVNIQSNTLPDNKMKLKLNKRMKKLNPNARNKYIHFTLFKSNIDTMGAVFRLSKLTGISQKVFSTAGLKDKRGVTTQMVSVFNSDVRSLEKFYQHANKNKEIWISDFQENQNDSIGVGDLAGNQFGLILRLINPADAPKLAERVESIRNSGLINYFGMQRFGSGSIRTYMIGVKIVKRQWQEVVEELLLEDAKDEAINTIKKEAYEKGTFGKAEKQLPNRYKIEKSLFKGLQKYGNNFQNVFQGLPRSMRTLYCHSLQSYIWNRIVSRRIRQHGLNLVPGDLVGKKLQGLDKIKKQVQLQKAQKMLEKAEEQQGKDKLEEREEDEEGEQSENEIQDQYETIMITNENIGEFNIEDLVMPLYGPSLIFQEGCLPYKYLIDQLNALQLSEEDFRFNSKLLCFKGQYRRAFIKPKNVSCKIIRHKNPKDQIQSPFYMLGEEPTFETGQRAAAQIIIQLPKSSYATMALREILHIPSSFQTQTMLNTLYANTQTS